MGAESEASQSTGAVDENILPILVVKDERSKTLSGSFVLTKGVDGFAIKLAAVLMQRKGHEKIVNRSDGEHSIVLLKKKAAQLAQVQTVLQESLVGESRINGEVECEVKELNGLIRSGKNDLEHKLRIDIDRKHPIFCFVADVRGECHQQASSRA